MHFFSFPYTGVKKTPVDAFAAIRTRRHVGDGNIFRTGDDVNSAVQPEKLKVMAAAVATAAKRVYFIAGHIKTQMHKPQFVYLS